MAEAGSRIPHEALISLRHRLETLTARHADRKSMVAAAAAPLWRVACETIAALIDTPCFFSAAICASTL